MHKTSETEFYARLPVITDFDTMSDGKGFSALPDSWTVLVSDVVNSTGAVERGNYKAVNMVGAASIIAVLNACQGEDVPFMFGGDGGVVAVPPRWLEAAKTRLATLRDKCPDLYGLQLRAAAVPVADIREAGRDVRVARFALTGGNHLAMFAGGGLDLAEQWLKASEDGPYHLKPEDGGNALDLEGLSCRWQPLTSLNGTILTVIIQATGSTTASTLNRTIAGILGKPVTEFAPVQDANLKLEGILSRAFALERSGLKSTRGRYAGMFWTLLTGLCQRYAEAKATTVGNYDAKRYRTELKANTDFRKFDGALRMVLDITTSQADALEARLEEGYTSNALLYGTSRSDAALMTCLLFDLAQSRHVHFIDGADGGYTRAAKALKQRLALQRSA